MELLSSNHSPEETAGSTFCLRCGVQIRSVRQPHYCLCRGQNCRQPATMLVTWGTGRRHAACMTHATYQLLVGERYSLPVEARPLPAAAPGHTTRVGVDAG